MFFQLLSVVGLHRVVFYVRFVCCGAAVFFAVVAQFYLHDRAFLWQLS